MYNLQFRNEINDETENPVREDAEDEDLEVADDDNDDDDDEDDSDSDSSFDDHPR